MKIILIRHGEPNPPSFLRMSASEMKQWIESYNNANLCNESFPSEDSINLVRDCQFVVCSDLARSIASAKRLGCEDIHHISEAYREAGLPFCSLPLLRLPPKVWAVIFRLMWFLGFSANSESVSAFKKRAMDCSIELQHFAREKDVVLFVGHAFTNRFIAKHLQAEGWRDVQKANSEYWSTAIFEKASQ